ncbi:MAG: MBOAT family protein [Eubacterium sp.]|nr:MBOAT family protein [Eubacterium sp.]
MVFSSAVFVWLFLPIVFVVNCFLKTKISNLFLLAASLVFYAWGEPLLVFVMIISIVINWAAAVGIFRHPKYKKLFLIVGIVVNLGLLGYYKYAGFLVSMINRAAGRDLFSVPQIALPIGISFFTFQALSFVIDVYRGEEKKCPRLINTALYISFFPQLIAGPIVKYRDINYQIQKRSVTSDKVAAGFKRFIYGLGKKVLIANVLGACADKLFGLDVTGISGSLAWIASLLYTFQIYYDFSGYSDMAIGLGKMFGFRILENFDHPFLSKSIQEFWRRWHISLGSWFREYLYIPLGGNRKGSVRTYVNLFIVFFLTGLWHGANVCFIVWGLYHGILSVIERLGFSKVLNKHKAFGWIYTFLLANFGWVIFRMENMHNSLIFIKRMILPWKYLQYQVPLAQYVDVKTVVVLILAVIGCGLLTVIIPRKIRRWWKGSVPEAVFCVFVLVLCIAAMAANTYNPFIYFQF